MYEQSSWLGPHLTLQNMYIVAKEGNNMYMSGGSIYMYMALIKYLN